MRILSFNANGLRAAAGKGFFEWFGDQAADLLCVQEVRAQPAQLEAPVFHPAGYRVQVRAAAQPGYSGVAIYSRQPPDAVLDRLGLERFDAEGRYLEMRFGRLSVVSLYLPSGSSAPQRQAHKLEVMAWLKPVLDGWLRSDRDYVLCGDWNIVRSRRDIRNWTSNQKTSGCLPEERAWLNALCADREEEQDLGAGRGWVDSYRVLRPHGEDYTWWSNRGAAYANNVGWRIDYQLVSPGLRGALRDCAIARAPRFSDHAAYAVEYAG